jgi:hypothetical protein
VEASRENDCQEGTCRRQAASMFEPMGRVTQPQIDNYFARRFMPEPGKSSGLETEWHIMSFEMKIMLKPLILTVKKRKNFFTGLK